MIRVVPFVSGHLRKIDVTEPVGDLCLEKAVRFYRQRGPVFTAIDREDGSVLVIGGIIHCGDRGEGWSIVSSKVEKRGLAIARIWKRHMLRLARELRLKTLRTLLRP